MIYIFFDAPHSLPFSTHEHKQAIHYLCNYSHRLRYISAKYHDNILSLRSHWVFLLRQYSLHLFSRHITFWGLKRISRERIGNLICPFYSRAACFWAFCFTGSADIDFFTYDTQDTPFLNKHAISKWRACLLLRHSMACTTHFLVFNYSRWFDISHIVIILWYTFMGDISRMRASREDANTAPRSEACASSFTIKWVWIPLPPLGINFLYWAAKKRNSLFGTLTSMERARNTYQQKRNGWWSNGHHVLNAPCHRQAPD